MLCLTQTHTHKIKLTIFAAKIDCILDYTAARHFTDAETCHDTDTFSQ